MPRLQILELPMEHNDAATMDSSPPRTPFAVILDQVNEATAEALRSRPELLDQFAMKCGARTVGVFTFTVDLA
ncbi:hypothetical protein ACFUJT_31525 [Streptomyces griseoincarnatus]